MSEAAAKGMEETPQDPCSTDVRATETPLSSDPSQNGQLSFSGISILDRLIKTCPVWLQLCMGAQQAMEILCREASGVFLVTRDVDMKCMVLWVHSSECRDAVDVLHYNIREEKTMMYLEGSMLVFKDIFKLVAFYCVSRDVLPSVLKLPSAISSAQSLQDLEEISNLGKGFWDSLVKDKNLSSSSQCGKSTTLGDLQTNNTSCVQHVSRELGDCTCEIEISAGNDRLWFVTPIFIEECGNVDTSDKLPLTNCIAKPDAQQHKIMHRRPPPPPPPLHKPPLPSVPPSAPPPNYIHPHSDSHSSGTPTRSCSRPSTSERKSSALETSSTESSPTEPPSSSEIPADTDTQCSLSEQSHSRSLSTSPETPKPNLVDLLDHSSVAEQSVGSPSSNPSTVSLTDLLSPTESHIDFSLSTSISVPYTLALHTDSFTPTTKDLEVHPVEACPVAYADVDLLKEPLENMKISTFSNDTPQPQGPQTPTPVRAPPAVPRRRQSGKMPEDKARIFTMKDELEARKSRSLTKPDIPLSNKSELSSKDPLVVNGKNTPPVPPPRKKKLSTRSSSVPHDHVEAKSVFETEKPSNIQKSNSNLTGGKPVDRKVSRQKRFSTPLPRTSDQSLHSHGSDNTLGNPEADSYSTSSADEDTEQPTSASIKKSHSFMLDRAKNRLSIVAITNVFTAFMPADRKLQKRITELAYDKDSYFGNLVQDYKAYSLEMMAKQSSSTEMLQEIRLMMTQLKSYLVQSTELKAMVDHTLYTDDKIDTIVEAALCKCVLKPLKSAIECYLREIHNKDGSLRLLTENQQVIQEMTTTDLGVTTSVPDSSIMEKILHKFGTMHKTYSPEKKITYLLKSCKLIYDSMAAGNPGKHHGADDFLPVLMYVLAQCDLVALLLDVEYMMELMDPALQLGEGSYYLTTTYGALEHIKNYDKITVTRQLSMEVQDSIHRWERRRTLNKARVSRSSIQDFITISFEDLDSQTRTLATKPDMSVEEVVCQCAEKFEVSEPKNYGLFVLVNDRCLRLTNDSFPQQVKSRLLKNEQKLDFHFLYKRTSAQDTVMKELDFL
ncbi:ras and Rab interactor 3 isoform X2 [Engystomops pustulosus]|uniref:ras and Rab interactor 3 isoform X2 n=1 Tax=Engystomops pustulosus TaxID=76066 RepID=UPI003AFA5B56